VIRPDRPVILIQIERRHRLQQVHIRFVVRIDGPDVFPVPVLRDAPGFAAETVRGDPPFPDQLGQNVLAEVMA